MGSGKSTFGKRLAHQLGYGFIDLDMHFEETYKISISDFFSKYGEDVFRRLEHELLEKNLNQKKVVISCGGGTACYFDNMQLMNQNGLTVYLHLTVPALAQRLVRARRKRPLIAALPGKDLEQKITSHLAQRESYYLQAQIILEGLSIDLHKAAEKIRLMINERCA
jgi:shikimate kinase